MGQERDTGRILIVDDDALLAGLLAEIFAGAPYDLEFASGGLEAIERARACHPDVIILDVSLPDIDGFEVFRLLCADPDLRRARVILMTGHAHRGALEIARDLGAFDFLQKPFRIEALEEAVRRALAHARPAAGVSA